MLTGDFRRAAEHSLKLTHDRISAALTKPAGKKPTGFFLVAVLSQYARF